MQSEASEVTLGGKAHVGPGCVCATRHQPSWLDREFSSLAIFACVRSFPLHDVYDYIGRRSLELGASRVFLVIFTFFPRLMTAYVAVKR